MAHRPPRAWHSGYDAILGDGVRLIRISLGYTQRDLAARLREIGWDDCEERAIGARENGQTPMSVVELILIARALRIGPAVLLHPSAIYRLTGIHPGEPRSIKFPPMQSMRPQ